MSYTAIPILLYGWTGSQQHIGSCAKAFGDKYKIECDDSKLCLEIIAGFSKKFNKKLVESDFRIELSYGDDCCDTQKYYFGIACYDVNGLSHKDMKSIQKNIVQAFEKAMEGLEYPEPTFNNVVYWS